MQSGTADVCGLREDQAVQMNSLRGHCGIYNSKQGRGGDKWTKINAAPDARLFTPLIAHARLPPEAKTVFSSGQIIASLMNCCRIRSFHRPANSGRLYALNANASTNIYQRPPDQTLSVFPLCF